MPEMKVYLESMVKKVEDEKPENNRHSPYHKRIIFEDVKQDEQQQRNSYYQPPFVSVLHVL